MRLVRPHIGERGLPVFVELEHGAVQPVLSGAITALLLVLALHSLAWAMEVVA